MNMRKRAVGRSWKTSTNSSRLYAKEALPPPLILNLSVRVPRAERAA